LDRRPVHGLIARQETVLQKPPAGVPQRQADRLHPARAHASTASRINRRSVRAARAIQDTLHGRAAETSASVASKVGAALRSLSAPDRLLPLSVATIVAVASLLAVLPSTSQGAIGATEGAGSELRLAINGGFDPDGRLDPIDDSVVPDGVIDRDDVSFRPFVIPNSVDTDPEAEQATLAGPVQDDGTVLTGYAPNTDVEDGADLIETYKVKSGDTLVDIAHRNDVSMMTLWWANHLKSKDDLSIGQVLRIPPVNGLVYTVKDTDTLDVLADRYNVSAKHVMKLNGLEDPTLVVGQVLVLPGAKGAPIPTPKPTPKPDRSTNSGGGSSGGGGGNGGGGVHYSGGQFRWPVIGGGNYISQYFHYGHEAIDIAADYGSHVVAATSGHVIFAGWKSNGGGYQVWIAHGGGLYTTYNHMSAITVGNGQNVGRGQQVGRVGSSGMATGPHLHFEVWIGPVWNGGTRVNPLRYF
jgi:murein DD-endopeptidase MepM/ murein hydrolase activator NlpD